MSAPNIPSSARGGEPNAIPGSGPVPVPGLSASSNTQSSASLEEQSTSQGPQLISVQRPTGGGAIQSIGEKFTAQPATGTATLSIPIGATEARPGGTPSLALGYSSGSGNGPFGIGWSLNIGSITRRVSKGRPQYEDGRDSDVFILQDEEDLVPTSKQPQIVGDYSIRRYQPRSEGNFARIERVTHKDDPADVHWRVTSRDNVLSVYGRDDSSRIQSESEGYKQIFSWLLCETYDVSGNTISYVYKSEDDGGIDLSAVNERNRTTISRSTQRYIKSIRYGNNKPTQRTSTENPTTLGPLLSGMPSTNWAFELTFDYGDHHPNEPTPGGDNPWPCRQDPFSAYRPGFEVRTYRLCRRVLMFHRFPDELGVDALLVNALELTYIEQPTISCLKSVTRKGYVKRDTDSTLPDGVSSYFSRALPPLDFEYTAAATGESLARSVAKEVDSESLENLPEGVTGSSYQWLDLYGEGLQGVFSAQGGSWFYKRNLSAAGTVSSLEDGTLSETVTLGPMRAVDPMPNISDTDKPRFVDLNGDGSLDVADMTGRVKGFYKTTAETSPDAAPGQWDEFRPFESWPSGIDVEDPNVRFIDLTGDGRADILITEDQVLIYHVSLGSDGYGASRRVRREADEERGPRVLFSDIDESVYFADMSGDGTSDLCRVRNGDICYWPNLGYGRFGAKVTMNDSPHFDRPEAFTQRRVLMTDIDGSGATDIIYVGAEGVTLHFNNSGNGWAKAESLPSYLLPPIDTLASITATDLMGNGTNCLVWSSSAASYTRSPLRYIDFNNGIKPHLLVKITNNIGKETNLSYLPSTTFYLRDEIGGKPWATRLPFPVQCLERVRTYDAVGRSYHTSRYAYHHGYFDGHDREFRGFGMTEQWDTENFGTAEKFSPAEAANIDEMSFSPPVLTKRWYHTGVYVDHEQLQKKMAREYAGAASLTADQFEQFFAKEVVRDLVLDSDDLTPAEARDASRALKGSLLREEVYALDESPLADLPYRIIDYGFNVKTLQRHGESDVSVCHTYQREQVAYSSEREAAPQNDRRIQHGLTLKVGDYGNILCSVQISYGRAAGKSPLEGEPKALQETTRIVLDDMSYTNAVDEKGDAYSLDYRAPLQSSATKYELFGVVLKEGDVRFEPDDFILDKFTEVPFDSPVTGSELAKRVMAKNATLYRKNDLTDMLQQGNLESMAIEGMSYTLALTPELLTKYKRGGKALISDEEDVLHNNYKYERLKGDDANWWLPTAKMFYHVNPAATPAEELESAKTHFFTPLRILDPYGFSSTVELDSHFLTLKTSTDAVNNVSSYVHDYSNMKPILITDPNGNRSAFKYDCLGRLVASSVMGKESETLGDSLDEIQVELAEHEMGDFAAEPVEHSADLLKGATARYIYDLEQYCKGNGPSTPTFVATLSRFTHVSDLAEGVTTQIHISFTYFDGLGREVQTKAIAEHDSATPLTPRWVGSAWKVLDNKDNAVRVFNPFFDDTHAFKADWKVGVSPYFMYDALGRLVATAMPNKTWTKVVYDSWETTQFDANDTVLMDPKSDPDVGTYFSRLPDSEYLPTWHDQRKDGAMGAGEKKAAEKSALHNNTPVTITVDAMGNEFLSTKDNGNSEKFITYRVFDAKGLPREMRDAKGRLIERKTYDAVGNEAIKETMDTANTWMLYDATASLVLSWHGNEQKWRRDYDALGRETHKYLLEGEEDGTKETLFEMRVYGESESEPEKRNLRGQLFHIYDQAGTETNTGFNFKGELVTRQRQLAVEYTSTLDWSDIAGIALEPDIHSQTTYANALGQTTYSQSADGSALRYTYNIAGLPETIESNIRGEKKPNSDDILWVAYVTGVEYNELAYATTISFGNGQRTINDFDNLTLLLKTRQTVSSQKAGAKIQDLGYTYDPSGNITYISNNAQQDVFFRNRVVSADVEYTYDATYRLIESSGREQLDEGGKAAPPGAFQAFENEPRSGDPLSRYVESFNYDSANNILSVQHSTADEKAPAWTRSYKYEEASALEPEKMGNRLSSTQVGSVIDKYGYDGKGGEFGCLTSMPHLTSMGWNSLEQLKMTTSQNVNDDGDNGGATPERTWYVYDSRGARIRKVIERQEGAGSLVSSPRKLKEWTYLGDYELFRKYAGDGVTVTTQSQTTHVHGSNGRLALIEDWTGDDHPGRLIRYQVVDHLDAVAIEVDENGELVSYEEYSAYGSTMYQMQDTQRPKRFRWASKERDKENGFYYSEARYYAPWLGRWISADPAGVDDDLNTFAYVGCRPTEYSDPTGLGKTKATKGGGAGGVPGVTKTIKKTPKEQSDSRMKLRYKRIIDIRKESKATAPIMPSDPNTIIQGETAMRNLLAATWERTQLHHVYPQEYRDQFKKIGIDVDNFTVSITDEVHRICTVGGEANGSKLGKWNDRWNELFFKFAGSGYDEQMKDYDTLDPTKQYQVRSELLERARRVSGIIMAEYGLRHLYDDGQTKFLDYNYIQNMKEDSERSQIKSANLIHHKSWATISSVSYNAAVSDNGMANNVSALQFSVTVNDFSSLTGEQKAAWKTLFGTSLTPPSSVAGKSPGPSPGPSPGTSK
ncbi:putative YD repeat protein [Rosellinia necatrix]|uniref:Putative YD repeat protein n=1 Tax=Rosellinia necatrix TaxID=77044 RepID=A0A1W2TPU6_ROSNE|nr:putative YD repeat protein [Rosellinia necatrix]